jgi:hypothetical protein
MKQAEDAQKLRLVSTPYCEHRHSRDRAVYNCSVGEIKNEMLRHAKH